MDTGSISWRSLAGLLALSAGLAMVGCQSSQKQTASADRSPSLESAEMPIEETEDEALRREVEAQVALLESWFEEGAAAHRVALPPEPALMGEIPEDDDIADAPPPAANAGIDPATITMHEEADLPEEITEPVAEAPSAPPEPPPTLEQRIARLSAELSTRLREQADGSTSPLEPLAALAAMELLDPGASTAVAAAGSLAPSERRAFELWRDMFRYAGRRLTETGSPDALLDALAAASEQARDLTPMRLTRVALCTRVDGFGQFEEMQSTALLAGQRHRLGLYAEVDHFGTRESTSENGQPGHLVELSRELSLYHDADGLLAWRRPAVDIKDWSRNRRRDFFFSERIELPQTLTVGSYRLKVTVTDKTTGAVAESIIPVSVVADARLTRAQER